MGKKSGALAYRRKWGRTEVRFVIEGEPADRHHLCHAGSMALEYRTHGDPVKQLLGGAAELVDIGGADPLMLQAIHAALDLPR